MNFPRSVSWPGALEAVVVSLNRERTVRIPSVGSELAFVHRVFRGDPAFEVNWISVLSLIWITEFDSPEYA